MNNIHSLQDDSPESARRMQQRRNNPGQEEDNGLPWGGFAPAVTQENINYAEQNRVLLVSGGRKVKNPRDENYWDMLVSTFCPTFSFLSVTIFLILADIAMFIAELAVGFNTQGAFLEVNSYSLNKLGANYAPQVADGEVYRLVSAIFLHTTFFHILGNLFSTFILVTRIQYTFRPLKTFIVYILSGIGGNIFSLAVDSRFEGIIKAGASTALYGMIGVVIGYIIINWVGLKMVGEQLRCNSICLAMFLLIFVIIFTPSTLNRQIDYYGHLGGFLTGLWASAIHQPLVQQKREKIIRATFASLLSIQFLATFLPFFLSRSS